MSSIETQLYDLRSYVPRGISLRYLEKWFGNPSDNEPIVGEWGPIEDEHLHAVSLGMQLIFNHETGIRASGSAVSAAATDGGFWSTDRSSPGRSFFDPFWNRPFMRPGLSDYEAQRGLIGSYYAGNLNPASLSPEAYGMIHLYMNVIPNLDYHGYDALTPFTPEATEILASLLRYSDTFGNMGMARTISKIEYYGRFKRIVLWSPDYPGGINFILLPPDWSETYTTTVSFRAKAQTAQIIPTEGGWKAVIDKTALDDSPVGMVKTPDTVWGYYQHVARTIRTMVLNSIGMDRLQVKSFTDKKLTYAAETNSPTFEQALSIGTNLATAFIHELKSTGEIRNTLLLMKWLQIYDSSREALYSELLNCMTKSIPFNTTNHNSAAEWLQFVTTADKEFFGTQTMIGPDFTILSALLAAFMPVSAAEFRKLIPEPQKREVVQAEISGNDSLSQDKNPRWQKNYGPPDKQFSGIATYVDAALAFWQLTKIALQLQKPPTEILALASAAIASAKRGIENLEQPIQFLESAIEQARV